MAWTCHVGHLWYSLLTCRFCSSRVLSAAQICFGKKSQPLGFCGYSWDIQMDLAVGKLQHKVSILDTCCAALSSPSLLRWIDCISFSTRKPTLLSTTHLVADIFWAALKGTINSRSIATFICLQEQSYDVGHGNWIHSLLFVAYVAHQQSVELEMKDWKHSKTLLARHFL